jgi:hypothetical protein
MDHFAGHDLHGQITAAIAVVTEARCALSR